MTAIQLHSCIAERWSPQIGDPNLTGWLTVLVYLFTALLSFAAWHRMAGQPGRMFWAIIVGFLIFLAINKQLDMQSALTIAGKCLAKAQEWYANRRIVQVGFITVLLIVILICFIITILTMRDIFFVNIFAIFGLMTLLSFIMVRAVSIHHFDYFIGSKSFGFSNNFIFENFGLILISANAIIIIISKKSNNFNMDKST